MRSGRSYAHGRSVPNNNPGGENGYLAYGQESAYGAQKRLEESTKAAPVAQPGVAAPKRAQRRAVNGKAQAAPQQPPVTQQLAQAPPTPENVWAEVASIPGISPLVLEWANGA